MIGKTTLHYKILKELGRGGMGVVYKAEHMKLKRKEAIAAIARETTSQGARYYFLSYLPLRHLPIYDSLRDEPQFQELLIREREKYEERLEKYSLIETG